MTKADIMPLISADNEWSPLRSVIVGRAEDSAFPSEPYEMMRQTMPTEHLTNFKPQNPFPADILANAQRELDHFAQLLQQLGVRVYRPSKVDWVAAGGYTGAMPRDGLMTVGSTLIEAPFAWRCRRDEIQLAYADILAKLAAAPDAPARRICRAPIISGKDSLYDDARGAKRNGSLNGHVSGCRVEAAVGVNADADADTRRVPWAINNSRPAFDAADFMRFGKTVVGQMSHVTNARGVEYLRAVLPDGYSVEILETTDEHAMHIDATILPLREGLLIYHPDRVSETELRRHAVFTAWELHAYPFVPKNREAPSPPMYMCSPWLVLNALSIDDKRIMVEAGDTQFASWVQEKFGMEPIMCPFQHVNSIGGSFHCATVDLVRETAAI